MSALVGWRAFLYARLISWLRSVDATTWHSLDGARKLLNHDDERVVVLSCSEWCGAGSRASEVETSARAGVWRRGQQTVWW